MITNEELLEFQSKLKEAKTDDIHKVTEIFQSKVTGNIKTILEGNPMVYDNRTFDESNRIMTDAALLCLEKWNVKTENSFNKFLAQFAFLSNNGLWFLRNTIINGQTAINEFKDNVSPLDKDMKITQSKEEALCLEEWKAQILNRFKEWQDYEVGFENYFKATISLEMQKLYKLQKMTRARDEAINTFFYGIKPTIRNIISNCIFKRGIVPRDETEHRNWIDAASVHTVEILKKWDPERGTLFKTYLLRSKGQILDIIANIVWTGKRQESKKNLQQSSKKPAFMNKGVSIVLPSDNTDNIKKTYPGETHLSIDATHNSDSGDGWTLRDAIIDPRNNTPEKEFDVKELQKELDKTESLDKILASRLAKRLTNIFINLGSDIQTSIIDSCINNTSDSKIGQKLGKYRKTVTKWKRKGLKTLKDEIEDFFCHENFMDIHQERQKRIIITALEQLLGKE